VIRQIINCYLIQSILKIVQHVSNYITVHLQFMLCATSNFIHKRQLYVIKNLRRKLVSNNVILVPSDKGRTIVAVDNTVYVENVNNFVTSNQFSTLTRDPTEKYQKQLHKILQQSNTIINKHTVKYLLQNKPRPPVLLHICWPDETGSKTKNI
jgi:hypothetical protein